MQNNGVVNPDFDHSSTYYVGGIARITAAKPAVLSLYY
jgi:hypothetical protein